MRVVPDNNTEFISIGKISKVHGINGELILSAEDPIKSEILETEQVFILIEGLPVPFFISTIEERNEKTFVLEFDTVDSRDEAEELVGCEILIGEKKKKGRPKKKFTNSSIIGYSVIDNKLGRLGSVEEIIEYPGHSVLRIINGKKEILIPVHEDIIVDVNDSSKEIIVEAPEGLIDLYHS